MSVLLNQVRDIMRTRRYSLQTELYILLNYNSFRRNFYNPFLIESQRKIDFARLLALLVHQIRNSAQIFRQNS